MCLTVGHAMVLGLAVRLAALLLLPDQKFPDAEAYLTAGRDLFETGTMRVHRYMPLYPIWTYITGGGWTLKVADIGLAVATIWIVHQLAIDIFRQQRVALLAAFVAALYPHFVFYSVSGLTETAFLFLLSLSFLLLFRKRWLGASVFAVLSILVRPTLDLVMPILICVFVVAVHRGNWRSVALRLMQYAAVYLALMSPWWAHQYVKYDRFVRLNLGDGIVWFAGNHPGNSSGGGVERDEAAGGLAKPSDFDAAAVARFAPIADEYEQNEAMKRAAFEYIRENPGRFIEMAGVKFVRFWRLWPYAPEYERPMIVFRCIHFYWR